MRETVIVSAARTPFGKFGGGLSALKAEELGGIVIEEAIRRTEINELPVDYVYMGHVLQGGCGQVTARQAARLGGLPWETPAISVNKVCSSGLISVALADMKIRSSDADVIVAGGMESMSNAPFYTSNMRWGNKMGDTRMKDLAINDGLWCAFYDRHMAVHGSEVSKEFGISRQAQDEWALRSQQYASNAITEGRLAEEIVSVKIGKNNDIITLATDEAPRKNTRLEDLAKLPPVFTKDGTVTAGNAPGLNDGAGALVLMSKGKAQQLGIKPLATIIEHAEVSQDAKYIATVPGLSTLKLLQKVGMSINDIDLIEANEAFAAVALVSGQIAQWDEKKVNVDGGAIALGHPIGASGARILMHLAYSLKNRGGGYGIACICSGAAQGDAMLIKVD